MLHRQDNPAHHGAKPLSAAIAQQTQKATYRLPGPGRLQPAERITVSLIPKAVADLQRLQDRTGLSKTNLVNRAIMLYEFVDRQT